MKEFFRHVARVSAEALGSPWSFMVATFAIVAWAVTGPVFHFSDAWQLVVNTATNVITFLMVFMIQATQNRDTKATQLKLDELLRAVEGARTGLVNLEALSDEDLAQLQTEFERLQRRSPLGPATAQEVAQAAATVRTRDEAAAKRSAPGRDRG